ncbi:MAG TPA: hypothetical protein VGL81_23280 [Polyangiaceae bacterium]|jgi:phage tail tape-measure protein
MSKIEQASALAEHKHHTGEVATIAGEIAGAVLGSAAGPAGVVAGMVIGALAGALTGEGLEAEAERARRHDEDLDEALGITKGDVGAVQPGNASTGPGSEPEDESSPDWPMKRPDEEPAPRS